MKAWCLYCCKTTQFPTVVDEHSRDCPLRLREERNLQSFRDFITGFRSLLKDSVDLEGDRWRISLRSGSTVINLTVNSVNYRGA